MEREALKRRAAEAAVAAEVRSGMCVGVGTGTTMAHAIDVLGEALREGRLRDVSVVPTSEQTAAHVRRLGIPIVELHTVEALDVTLDGADEIDPSLDLIKGLGGALLREKMVAQASERLAIIADGSKWVRRLGQQAPLPVEVVIFGWRAQLRFLEALGARPVRRVQAGEPLRTDNGNFIIDCHFDDPGGIPDPAVLDWQLLARAGIVEHGLFLDMTDVTYVASEAGVEVRRRADV